MTNVCADLSASIWKIKVSEGETVVEDDVLIILESMKMEIPVTAPSGGVVKKIHVKEGDIVAEGDLLVVID